MIRPWLLAGVLAALAALGFVLPQWLIFLVTIALAKGLAVLGVVLLMRAGLVSFGQAMFLAAGAYAAGFAAKHLAVREAVVQLGLGVAAGLLLAAITGLLVARYRDIFFSMLTLAFSMAVYGVLVKAYHITGGSDGLRVPLPTVLGLNLPAETLRVAVWILTLACVAAMVYLSARFRRSPLGYLVEAIRDNEVRVQYLGGSVARTIFVTYLAAGGLAGLGGALQAISVGHVDPLLAYWTTSGEVVFVALLSGTTNVLAPLGGTIVFELIKSYAFKYAPYTWQMVLGVAMLLIVIFLPGGLWTLYERLDRRVKG